MLRSHIAGGGDFSAWQAEDANSCPGAWIHCLK